MKTVLFSVIFYILAYTAGGWGDLVPNASKAGKSYALRIATGGCLILAGAMAVSLIPLPVNASAIAAAAVTLAISVTGVIASAKIRAQKTENVKIKPEAADIVLIAAAIMIMAFQIYAAYAYRTEITQAIRQVGTASAVYEQGRTFAGDPMMVLIGTLSSVFSLHPLAFVHSVAPPVFIVLYYLCYLAVIETVLTGRKRIVAFIAAEFLSMWGYQSAALAPATLLLSWYGIWVYVIHGLLAVAAATLIRYVSNREVQPERQIADQTEEDPEEEWDMKKHRIINARNLAIALAALAVLLMAAVSVLNNKINQLHEVTVSLQNEQNGKCSVYEFTGASGEIEGYLLKGSDGKVTFIGGGAADNAGSLKAFIEEHGTDIDTWYVYGEGDEDAGAMRELTSSGQVSCSRIYVMNREEIKEQQ